ncbi:LysM peptidoglycan-binding domain-containing protein [Romboutsia sp. MSSM.1001216sp_RTP31141st1_G3_RTP31141_220114]|uniref:LysM peptidoglycan-binding domain-containing protein n=1 Tax=unclassified Romboutsia TaxID=2626894 RepID=UPI0031B5CB8B
MAYSVYLDKILLPITPSKLELKINNKNKTTELINIGEVNILKTPGLTDINFKARIPHIKYPFANYENGFKNAKYFLDNIEKLKINNTPFQFIVSRTSSRDTILFHTNLKVSLEEYSVEKDAENNSDLNFSIKLKQFRDYSSKKIVVNNTNKPTGSVANKRPNGTNKPNGKTYTVKKGDSLWAICKTQLGDGSKKTYDKVYQLNKELMDSYNKKYGTSKYTIYPGQVLRLAK